MIDFRDCRDFIPNEFDIPEYGVKVVGYFPYEKATIATKANVPSVPGDVYVLLKNAIHRFGINDNKIVVICKPIERFNTDNFALQIKDGKVRIAKCVYVVSYDQSELKLK